MYRKVLCDYFLIKPPFSTSYHQSLSRWRSQQFVTSHSWNKTCFEKWWKSRAVLVWLWSTLLITYGRLWPARCLWWTCKYRYPRPKAWTNVSLSLSAWFSTLLTHMVAYPAEFINPTAWSSKVGREARSPAPSKASTLTNRKLDFAAAIWRQREILAKCLTSAWGYLSQGSFK